MKKSHRHHIVLAAALIVTLIAYWPGLYGSFLFDDYPNIVDNHGLQPKEASIASLVSAALSSPSSEFKRPLASLSFAVNYLWTGLDPFWMKLTNLLVHLLNGLLVYVVSRSLIRAVPPKAPGLATETSTGLLAALIAAGWMLLPINLTAVLYVVQRMESLANLFVLLGLALYIRSRQRIRSRKEDHLPVGPFAYLSAGSAIALPTAVGLLAKETAIMLPLYACLTEWVVFGFRRAGNTRATDWGVVALFLILLVIPGVAGLSILLPGLLRPETWAIRDFTLATRLLSESRIVLDYMRWSLLPTPSALSFYHDDFVVSSGLFSPWSTIFSITVLAAILTLAIIGRRRYPLAALGMLFFLGSHLLTGTIIPLELIYEHRNYYGSFGLLLAIVPALFTTEIHHGGHFFLLAKRVLFIGLLGLWALFTALTARAWGNPLSLAEELAARAPDSPRAQYELGRTYIVLSGYDPTSPFVDEAYEPLEKAAAMPRSSILPQQALIFLHARIHRPIKDAWWDSLTHKLKDRVPGIQDESSMGALVKCARDKLCDLSTQRMMDAFMAALSHPNPSPRLLSMYSDYAWNVLEDRELGLRLMNETTLLAPREPAYWITLTRMYIALGDKPAALKGIAHLEQLNIAGSLSSNIEDLVRASEHIEVTP
jgi:hypothetical protein